MKLANTIKAVSLLEAAKGVVVLLAGCGVLSLIHHDVQKIAEQLVAHLHLNPAKYYPRIFLDTTAHITDYRLRLMCVFALSYALARFIESYGLWRRRHWAEWFAAVSGGIYIPFEIFELIRKVDFLSISLLIVNLLIVGIMITVLFRQRSLP